MAHASCLRPALPSFGPPFPSPLVPPQLMGLSLETLPTSLDAAFAAVFAQHWRQLSGESELRQVRRLLAVLAAAQEGVPRGLLGALRLGDSLTALPSWGVLFREVYDHRVLVGHSAVLSWLRSPAAAAAGFGADEGAGHVILACRMRERLRAGRPLGSYGARHALLHMRHAAAVAAQGGAAATGAAGGGGGEGIVDVPPAAELLAWIREAVSDPRFVADVRQDTYAWPAAWREVSELVAAGVVAPDVLRELWAC